MNKNCKFCNKPFHSSLAVHNFYIIKSIGSFYKCDTCKVMIQPKELKNLYVNQDSSNYNFNKNFFYYLKQIILIYFIFTLRKLFHKKKDILDYGCGSGELATALSFFYKDKNIYTSDVFELEDKFIPKIKDHYLLHKGQLKGKKFDVIFMRHVFEHILNLNNFVKNIKENLKNKDSLLVIEVPNMDSLWKKIMKKRWPGYFYPFHYYVFSKIFLKNFFHKNGLKIVKKKNLEPPIFGSYLLSYGINKPTCKFLSLILYPVQLLISKIFLSSEAILLVVKKNSD